MILKSRITENIIYCFFNFNIGFFMKDDDSQKIWKDYLRLQRKYHYIPKDPYSHQASLLFSFDMPVENFSDLLNQHLLLGNIEDPTLLATYQEEIFCITNFFAMAKVDPNLREFFELIYYAFLLEIRMSVLYQGQERKLQSFMPIKDLMRKSRRLDFLKRRKKKLTYEDILMPEEDYYMYME